MKNKKFLKAIATITIGAVASVGCFTVAACSSCDDEHSHSYTYTSAGADGHYGECDCGDKTELLEHIYDDDEDTDCNACGYIREIGGGEDKPGGGEDNPGGGEDNPGGGEDNPGGGEDNPGGGENNPGGGEDNPGGGEDNPGGGEETPAQTLYQQLVASENKLYNNEFATDATVGVHNGFGNVGVYATEADAVVIADGVIKHEGNKSTNPSIVIDFGALETGSVLEGYMELSCDAVGSKWNLVRFISGSDAVFTLRTPSSGENFVYSLDNGTTEVPAEEAVAIAKDTTYKLYYKIDLTSGKITVTLNDKKIVTELAANITNVNGIYVCSSNSGARHVTIDNVVFCGTEMAVANYAPIVRAKLDTEYAKYILEDGDEVTATHKINADLVTEAYESGVTAIKTAESIGDINAAYDTAVAAMKAVLSDAQIVEARAAAIAAIDEKFPAADYTYAFEGDDAIYNNKSAYESEIAAIKARINEATTQSALDAIVDGATISAENDAAQLAAKKADAKDALAAYEEDAINEIEDESVKANIATVKADGAAAIDAATSIDAVNSAVNMALTEVDNAIASQSMTPEEYRPVILETFQTFVEGKLEEVYNDEYIAKINAAVETHTANINAAETNHEIDAAYEDAKAAIEAIIDELKAEKFTVTFSGAEVTAQEVIYSESAEKPANPVNSEDRRFVGWYTEEDGDVEFDFTAPVYDNVTVYAKWINADITVNYYIGDNLLKTVKLFSTDNDAHHLFTALGGGRKLVGWYTDSDLQTAYTATEWEVGTLNLYAKFTYSTNDELADQSYIVQKQNYTVPSIGEDSKVDYSTGTTFNAGADIVDNGLFNLTGEVETAYFAGISKLPSATFFGESASTALTHGLKSITDFKGSTDAPTKMGGYVITAKEDINILVYVSVANDTYNSDRTGSICYKLNGGNEVVVNGAITARATLVVVNLDLKAGDELVVYGYTTNGSATKVWLFGVEAQLADDFTNATIVYHGYEEDNVVNWNTLNSVADSKPSINPTKAQSTFIGWATTEDATEAVDLETLTITAGDILDLYPVFKTADIKVTYIVDGEGDFEDWYCNGDAVELYNPLAKEGYNFDGWYTDTAYENKYEVPANWVKDDLTDSALTLYGHYVEKPATVPDAIDISGDKNTSGHSISFTSGSGYFTVAGVNNYKYADVLGGALIGTSKGRGLTITAADNIESITITIRIGIAGDSKYDGSSATSTANVTGAVTGTITHDTPSSVCEYTVTLTAGQTITITGVSNLALVGATAEVTPKAE